MKLKFIFLLLLMSSHFTFSQRTVTECFAIPIEDNKNGKVINYVFNCYKFEWEIKIPENYQVMDLKMSQKLLVKGVDALREKMHDGTKIKREPNYLISFGLDNKNIFAATFEPKDANKIMSLEEHRDFITKLYREAYASMEEIKLKAYSSMITIGKYEFYRVYGKIYDSESNKLLFTQQIYNCFIGNNLFSVSINYENEKVGKELIDNFMSSLAN